MKKNETTCEITKSEIEKLESRITKIEENQKKSIDMIGELIYLCTANFLGTLTNERVIADLRREKIFPEKNYGICSYRSTDRFTFERRCEEIRCGYVDAYVVHECYKLIKAYEKTEEQVKRYSEVCEDE